MIRSLDGEDYPEKAIGAAEERSGQKEAIAGFSVGCRDLWESDFSSRPMLMHQMDFTAGRPSDVWIFFSFAWDSHRVHEKPSSGEDFVERQFVERQLV